MVLKCIWNEIFDNDFIGPFESAFEDKTIAIYRLLISGLDSKLWRSEVVKIVNLRVKKWQEIGHKINKNWSNLWRHNVYISNRWLFKWLYTSSLVTYQNRIKFCTLMAQYTELSWSCGENCCPSDTVGPRSLLFKTIMLQMFFCHKQKLTLCMLLSFAFMSRTSWW